MLLGNCEKFTLAPCLSALKREVLEQKGGVVREGLKLEFEGGCQEEGEEGGVGEIGVKVRAEEFEGDGGEQMLFRSEEVLHLE